MGSYLSKPKKTITVTEGGNNQFVYCTAEMQGWRQTQEDAHVVLPRYDDKGASFFAVFDGHGGDEVSKYCALYMPNFIKSNEHYKEEEFIKALEDAFLKFDVQLQEPQAVKELNRLASATNFEDSIEEEEADLLKKEAQLPIEAILKNGTKPKPESEDNKDDSGATSKGGDEPKADEAANEDEKEVANENKDNGEVKAETGEASGSGGKREVAKKAITKLLQNFLTSMNEDQDEEDEESDDMDSEENEDEEEDGDSVDDEEDEEETDEEEDDEDENSLRSNIFETPTPGEDSGCTANVAIIREGILYVANVGDSRCVLSSNGEAVEMSTDHKPEDEIERDRITKAGGTISVDGRVNNGLNLSRAIGDHSYKTNKELPPEEQMISAKPDVRTHKIDPEKDEFVFLACDGIWNSMTSQEVVDFIHQMLKDGFKPDEVCKALFHRCLAPDTDGDGSGCDNMTCVLVLFKDKYPHLVTSAKRSIDNAEIELDAGAGPSGSNNAKKFKIDDEDLNQAGPSK